jgi:hypothetical protein
MGQCRSNGFRFTQGVSTEIAYPDGYASCTNIQSPGPLTMKLSPSPTNPNVLQVFLSNILVADVNFNAFEPNGVISANGAAAEIIMSRKIINIVLTEMFGDNILQPNINYGVGDVYQIEYVPVERNARVFAIREPYIQAAIIVRGSVMFQMGSNPPIVGNLVNIITNRTCSKNTGGGYCDNNNDCLLLSDCENVRIPAILIKAQTNTDGSDLGDATFQICDKIQYYDSKMLDMDDNNTCKIRYIATKDLKQTKFQKGNLNIASVLKGEGHTACEKLSNLFMDFGYELKITFLEFANNIMIYVVIRYILSKLIFGDFNMDYLLGKYYNTFIDNLGKSRFCSFVEIFLDCNSIIYDYDKYFKRSKDETK